MEIPFVCFYKIADSVTQQIRNCPYKTQTATTGRQPVLLEWMKFWIDLKIYAAFFIYYIYKTSKVF